MTPSRASLLALGLSLGCLALAAFVLADTTRARGAAGLWHLGSHAADCAGDPGWRGGPPTLVAEPFHAELLERRAPPASARCDLYRGYLVVHRASRLSLELHATGSARVTFGKQELLALEAGAVRITRRVERALAPGSHPFEVRTEQSGQLAYLRLSASIEQEDRASPTPLAARALLPLEHDALAPSQVDAERVRSDAAFARRTPARLSILLLALLGALLAPLATRAAGDARSARRPPDARLFMLGTLVIVAAIGAAAWSPTHIAIDPHFVAHGARAWRTVWLSIPSRSFVDAIPALGATEWTLGAAHALGGGDGPAVMAILVAALSAACGVGAARLLAGGGAASIALVLLVARQVLMPAPSLGRDQFLALAIAGLLLSATAIVARTRLGAFFAWRARKTSPSADPSSNVRLTPTGLARTSLALAVPSLALALALGAPLVSLEVPASLVVALALTSARDAWAARV